MSGTTRVLVDGVLLARMRHGGIARYFREVLPRVALIDPTITFDVWVPGPVELPGSPGIRVHQAWAFRPARLAAWANGIRFRSLVKGAQVFHSTYYTERPVEHLATVVTAYDLIDEHYFDNLSGNGFDFRSRIRRQFQSAQAVIAISESTRADVMRYAGVRGEQVTVCTLGVGKEFSEVIPSGEIAEFQTRHRTGTGYVLYVGHRFGYKNFGTLLRGWIRYRKEGVGAERLVCIGSSPPHLEQSHLDELIASGLAADFVLLGQVSERELRCAYRGAGLFVYPSLMEGFGLPVLEAAACGCPLLLSDIPVFREVAADQAEYFDPTRSDELAQRLAACLEPVKNRWLRDRVRDLDKPFSWDAAARIHAGVYRRVSKMSA